MSRFAEYTLSAWLKRHWYVDVLHETGVRIVERLITCAQNPMMATVAPLLLTAYTFLI